MSLDRKLLHSQEYEFSTLGQLCDILKELNYLEYRDSPIEVFGLSDRSTPPYKNVLVLNHCSLTDGSIVVDAEIRQEEV